MAPTPKEGKLHLNRRRPKHSEMSSLYYNQDKKQMQILFFEKRKYPVA